MKLKASEQQMIERIDKGGMVKWEEPAHVTISGRSGYACRLCIAQVGIRGSDRLMTAEEHRKHMEKKHCEP